MVQTILRLIQTEETRNIALRQAFKALHCGYFGSVLVEGHGIYAVMAGAMLVFVVADIWLHFEG